MALPFAKDHTDFAAQMCSRLCHDLISPVGAIANGLEILADESDPDMRLQVIELLNQSVQVTSAKLRFFRLAFGAPGGMEGAVDAREIRSAMSDFMETSKTVLDWQIPSPQLPKPHTKLVLIAAMTCADALVRGGTVSISGDPSEGYAVAGEGAKVVLDEEITRLWSGDLSDIHMTSRYAPYILFLAMLGSANMGHSLTESPGKLAIAVCPK